MCMVAGYDSNHKGAYYRMWNPKTKMVSETCHMVFLNWMFFKAPAITKWSHKEQEKPKPEDTEIESVQQDKRGGTGTEDIDANNDNASAADSMGSSVPDFPMVNCNWGEKMAEEMKNLISSYLPSDALLALFLWSKPITTGQLLVLSSIGYFQWV